MENVSPLVSRKGLRVCPKRVGSRTRRVGATHRIPRLCVGGLHPPYNRQTGLLGQTLRTPGQAENLASRLPYSGLLTHCIQLGLSRPNTSPRWWIAKTGGAGFGMVQNWVTAPWGGHSCPPLTPGRTGMSNPPAGSYSFRPKSEPRPGFLIG